MITSATNPRVKHARRLLKDGRFRKKEGQFVVEGTRWIKELIELQITPDYWLASKSWSLQNPQLIDSLSEQARPPLFIDDRILKETADTETPSGVLAVLDHPKPTWPSNPDFIVILDGIRDPGNLGTIIRSAAAAGVDGLLLGPGTVDPTNPKVVRSTMGALFRLPFTPFKWSDLKEMVPNVEFVAADGAGELDYAMYDWQQPTALIIGNEAHGVGDEARSIADQLLHIPMANDTESLNAAVAAAVMMFERQRQTRLHTGR